jgi:hypothetical protein
MRERQIVSAPVEPSGVLRTIVAGLVAFALGAGAIAAWKWMPLSSSAPSVASALPAPAPVPATHAPAPNFAGDRIGRAATAPLLRACIKSGVFEGFKDNPQAVYMILTATQTVIRIAPGFGGRQMDSAQIIEYWREVAECVFQQNSWHLCDADNRALAVELASGFVRTAASAAGNLTKNRDAQTILAENARVRTRILSALQARLRNGTLIAADFPLLQPTEIKNLLDEVKPVSNACAKS